MSKEQQAQAQPQVAIRFRRQRKTWFRSDVSA